MNFEAFDTELQMALRENPRESLTKITEVLRENGVKIYKYKGNIYLGFTVANEGKTILSQVSFRPFYWRNPTLNENRKSDTIIDLTLDDDKETIVAEPATPEEAPVVVAETVITIQPATAPLQLSTKLRNIINRFIETYRVQQLLIITLDFRAQKLMKTEIETSQHSLLGVSGASRLFSKAHQNIQGLNETNDVTSIKKNMNSWCFYMAVEIGNEQFCEHEDPGAQVRRIILDHTGMSSAQFDETIESGERFDRIFRQFGVKGCLASDLFNRTCMTRKTTSADMFNLFFQEVADRRLLDDIEITVVDCEDFIDSHRNAMRDIVWNIH